MSRACIVLAACMLWLGVAELRADPSCCTKENGCAASSGDAKDCHGCKDCKQKRSFLAWLFYRPPARTGCACLGIIPAAAPPPLYTFFPCTPGSELAPQTLCHSCNDKGKRFFNKKNACDDCGSCGSDCSALATPDPTAPSPLVAPAGAAPAIERLPNAPAANE